MFDAFAKFFGEQGYAVSRHEWRLPNGRCKLSVMATKQGRPALHGWSATNADDAVKDLLKRAANIQPSDDPERGDRSA